MSDAKTEEPLPEVAGFAKAFKDGFDGAHSKRFGLPGDEVGNAIAERMSKPGFSGAPFTIITKAEHGRLLVPAKNYWERGEHRTYDHIVEGQLDVAVSFQFDADDKLYSIYLDDEIAEQLVEPGEPRKLTELSGPKGSTWEGRIRIDHLKAGKHLIEIRPIG